MPGMFFRAFPQYSDTASIGRIWIIPFSPITTHHLGGYRPGSGTKTLSDRPRLSCVCFVSLLSVLTIASICGYFDGGLVDSYLSGTFQSTYH